MKKGLPAVFSNTSSAKGAARSGAVCSASVSNRATSCGQERRQQDLLQSSPGVADPLPHSRQGMGGADLVVAVGADQQQMAHLGMGDEMFDQIEGRRIQPLQIVEEQRQRMLGPSEHAEESPEHQLEAILAILGRQIGHRRLLADDEGKLGNQIDHELAVRAEGVQQGRTPRAHLRIAFPQDLMDQALEGLSQRGIGDVPLVLVELAGGKEPARRDQSLVQLVDQRGFSDARIARHQHQLRGTLGDDTIEGGEEGVGLGLAAIEFFRDQQPVGDILPPQRKGVDAALGLPGCEALPEIGFEAGRRLVTVLGGLGEKLQDDGRDLTGDALHPLARGHRLPGDMAMNPFHGIGGRERQRPRQHLVEGDAQGVEIAAGIDRAIHPAGLLRRHIGKAAGNDLGRRRRLALARQPGGDAEARQADIAGGVDEQVFRLDVLMDEAAPMQLSERRRQRDGEAEESRQLKRLAQHPLEGIAAGVLQRQHPAAVVADESQRAAPPRQDRAPVRERTHARAVRAPRGSAARRPGPAAEAARRCRAAGPGKG